MLQIDYAYNYNDYSMLGEFIVYILLWFRFLGIGFKKLHKRRERPAPRSFTNYDNFGGHLRQRTLYRQVSRMEDVGMLQQ